MDNSSPAKALLARLEDSAVQQANERDRPNYWSSDAGSLVTTANVDSVGFGTGHSIYQSSILPAIANAQSEVILVTCFWARSDTLTELNDALRKLSAKAVRVGTTIRVRICFSSASLLQKLLHTASLTGYTYAAARWRSSLSLPPPEELQGLDLEVKSIFVLPFSVMHPKFVIIDRRHLFLPSCNVSWEDWFEGCMELSGPITDQFVKFWLSFWASDGDRKYAHDASLPSPAEPRNADELPAHDGLLASKSVGLTNVRTIFLPSPHHRNPRYTLPWLHCSPPPPTPLNICLLALFANAEHCIFIQTPNLTSPPVLAALSAALRRGVNVHVKTSERLMILEQLVTAGTTTKRCVNRLVAEHKQRLRRRKDCTQAELEAGLVKAAGGLRVEYFKARTGTLQASAEPVQSHLKLTIIDDRIAVHGSGNMDRASWYTSQELGVAFISAELICTIKGSLTLAMDGRSQLVYDSGDS
ncbi:hypothetical protein LTR36_009752 [Oleoguttula mirabilis]|uniref:PLD phosphodiesterase domain-containing protein n=1 Tax=Oleoguttula mirabilis TaxID=1507867 RepID=A0AAV9J5B4_9PEZI|nr:hypothetical protein LTR36_009752 [Oleoguttula mirabilis]